MAMMNLPKLNRVQGQNSQVKLLAIDKALHKTSAPTPIYAVANVGKEGA
jgi:hypothetical protein